MIKVDPRYVTFRDNDEFFKTFITLSVTSVLKGEYTSSSLIVSMCGGVIGEHAMIGDFTFEFNVDEEVLLFIKPIEDEMWEIIGISGKLSIQLKDNEYVGWACGPSYALSASLQGAAVDREDFIDPVRGQKI